jgi:hypothetical protein
MMAHFIAAQRPGYLRKAVLIAIAAIVIAIAWAAVAFSQDGGTTTYVYTKGVLKPDGSLQQRSSGGHVFVYSHSSAHAMMAPTGPVPTTVSRDGKTWLTLTTAKDGTITISDPNGTGQPVITIPPGQSATVVKPEKR